MDELKVRDLQHELELALMEERLAEYVGLKGETQIRREKDLHRALRGFRLIGVEKWGYKEPPKMRRIMPGATTDWDFSGTSWELNTLIYVSAPSSLLWKDVTYYGMILCKYAGTYPLDEGRLVTQIRSPAATHGICTFRNNSAVGSSSLTSDNYQIWEKCNVAGGYDATKAAVRYRSGGVYSWLGERSYSADGAPPTDTWDLRRATWWVSAGVLIIRLERFYGGVWINALVSDFTDSANRFVGNANRRCGLFLRYGSAQYADDTEIWGP